MNYSVLTAIKNPILLLVFLFGIHSALFGQTSTKSPYSFFGIGDVESLGFAENTGMGDLKFAVAQPYQLNLANPAALASLSIPTFSAGATLNYTNTTGENVSQTNTNGYLRYIAVGLPLGKKFGFGFGLSPFSKMGYSIVELQDDPELGAVETRYFGEGGINKAYMTFSYILHRDSSQFLSIGVTPKYYFGTTNRAVDILFGQANAFNTNSEEQTHINGLNAQFGLNYKKLLPTKKSKREKLISLGASYELGRNLNGKVSKFAYTTDNVGFPKDTTVNNTQGGDVAWPSSIGGGIVFEIADDSLGRIDIGIDYSTTLWSDFNVLGESQGLNNQQQISVGMQYIPDEEAYRKFFKVIRYRAGFRYEQTRLNVDNKQLEVLGMSVGVGIPLIGSGTLDPTSSTINISAEFGQRGNVEPGLLQERFTNIVIGLTLTPGKWDKWFEKRRID